jgi:tetratricopeptide (TPR) repeat protein
MQVLLGPSADSGCHSMQAVLATALKDPATHSPAAINAGRMLPYMAILQQWLCHGLGLHQRRFLASLCIFPGSFSTAGAAAVNAGMSGKAASKLLGAMEAMSLVQRHRVDSSTPNKRYTMHAMIRHAARSTQGVGVPANIMMSSSNAASTAATVPIEGCGLTQWLQPRLLKVMALAKGSRQGGVHRSLASAFCSWMLQHREGPGQLLLRCNPSGPAPDPALWQGILRDELLSFNAAAGVLKDVLLAAGVLGSALDKSAARVGWMMTEFLGQAQLGEVVYRAVWAARVKRLGATHVKTLHAAHGRAAALQCLGRLHQAKELQEEVLASRMRLLGPGHIDTLTTKANLAVTLRDLAMFTEAKELQEQVLAAKETLLGPDHTDMLTAQNNLALTLQDLGQFARSKELHEAVLASREKILGPDHPHTLAAKNNLALALPHLGQVVQANKLHEEVVAASTKLLGPGHIDTLAAQHNLALTLHALGRFAQAKELQVQVEAGFRLQLGPDHLHTMQAQAQLSATLLRQR